MARQTSNKIFMEIQSGVIVWLGVPLLMCATDELKM